MEVKDKVLYNGYEGIINKVHTGQLKGCVDVKLDRGCICVDITDVKIIKIIK